VTVQLGEAARRLAGVELEVAVAGEFKRGKSSLLNSLIEQEVLPAGVLPLTPRCLGDPNRWEAKRRGPLDMLSGVMDERNRLARPNRRSVGRGRSAAAGLSMGCSHRLGLRGAALAQEDAQHSK